MYKKKVAPDLGVTPHRAATIRKEVFTPPPPPHPPNPPPKRGYPGTDAMGQVAMSALGSSRACSPRPSPPTVHCSSQCPPIVRTANVLRVQGGGGVKIEKFIGGSFSLLK